jgi:hypothetical protein
MLKFDELPKEYEMDELRLGAPDDTKVYRIKGTNLVYKEIAKPEDEDFYKELATVKNDVFVFPKELVYVKEKLVGYVMDFIQGVMIKNIDPNILVPELYAILREIEKGIAGITKRGISILDINDKNIIITPEKHARVVDGDSYSFVSEEPEYLIYQNWNDYNDTIMRVIAKDIIDKFGRFIDGQLQALYDASVYCEIPASVCFNMMLNYLQNKLGEEIHTLDEFKKALSLVQKR